MDNIEPAGQSNASKSGSSKLILPLVVIGLIILGVAGFMVLGKNFMSPKAQDANTKTSQVSQAPTTSNVIASIKDALAQSSSLKCEFTDESGRKTTSYMKSGKIRSDFTASDPKESGSMIMKDKKMYFWSCKQGTVIEFDIEAMTENVTPAAKTTPSSTVQNPKDIIESMEKFKEFCKPVSVDDVLFVPPTDVKFTDMSSVINNLQKSVSGVPQMSEEDIKALQEKYAQ